MAEDFLDLNPKKKVLHEHLLKYLIIISALNIIYSLAISNCGATECVHGQCYEGKCECERGWGGRACNTCSGRQSLSGREGVFYDDPGNYTENNQCSWVISAPNASFFNSSAGSSQKIRLHLGHFATECSWDHLYIYDGDSVFAPLRVVYSGLVVSGGYSATQQPEIELSSPYALIHFYSDAAYNLTGFDIHYRVGGCPGGVNSTGGWSECSGQGRCAGDVCECDQEWAGEACERVACPHHCSNNGRCTHRACVCTPLFTGGLCGGGGVVMSGWLKMRTWERSSNWSPVSEPASSPSAVSPPVTPTGSSTPAEGSNDSSPAGGPLSPDDRAMYPPAEISAKSVRRVGSFILEPHDDHWEQILAPISEDERIWKGRIMSPFLGDFRPHNERSRDNSFSVGDFLSPHDTAYDFSSKYGYNFSPHTYGDDAFNPRDFGVVVDAGVRARDLNVFPARGDLSPDQFPAMDDPPNDHFTAITNLNPDEAIRENFHLADDRRRLSRQTPRSVPASASDYSASVASASDDSASVASAIVASVSVASASVATASDDSVGAGATVGVSVSNSASSSDRAGASNSVGDNTNNSNAISVSDGEALSTRRRRSDDSNGVSVDDAGEGDVLHRNNLNDAGGPDIGRWRRSDDGGDDTTSPRGRELHHPLLERASAGAVVVGDVVYVVGGHTFSPLPFLLRYNISGGGVEAVVGKGNREPSARHGHVTLNHNGSLLVFGGQLADGSVSLQLWKFDPGTTKWTLLSGRRGSTRNSPSFEALRKPGTRRDVRRSNDGEAHELISHADDEQLLQVESDDELQETAQASALHLSVSSPPFPSSSQTSLPSFQSFSSSQPSSLSQASSLSSIPSSPSSPSSERVGDFISYIREKYPDLYEAQFPSNNNKNIAAIHSTNDDNSSNSKNSYNIHDTNRNSQTKAPFLTGVAIGKDLSFLPPSKTEGQSGDERDWGGLYNWGGTKGNLRPRWFGQHREGRRHGRLRTLEVLDPAKRGHSYEDWAQDPALGAQGPHSPAHGAQGPHSLAPGSQDGPARVEDVAKLRSRRKAQTELPSGDTDAIAGMSGEEEGEELPRGNAYNEEDSLPESQLYADSPNSISANLGPPVDNLGGLGGECRRRRGRGGGLCAPIAVMGAAGVVVPGDGGAEDDLMLVFFGYSPVYGFLNTVQEYHLGSRSWRVVPCGGAVVAGRYGHTAVWDVVAEVVIV
ncbi:uncharacterized protein LOC108665764, partial [Hyalella azteca]|uniref:Uncharacterized protein LOC108665764 n=1 Tax=Hyalella azteca TaxID=294128 RepID=A0A979FHX0_HYAAZ